MSFINKKFLKEKYFHIKEKSIEGRWITFGDIEPLLLKNQKKYELFQIGSSEEGIPIYKIKIGKGKKKILIWTQMHGNESTGTKAVFDLLNFITEFSNSDLVEKILNEVEIRIIPMLNPDGSLVYSRVNSNGIDLNRDAVNLVAKESRILRKVLKSFSPDFCFNLHDQRTIFGVEGTHNPATISFLAPSEEETRSLTKGRIQTMDVIGSMNNLLQQIIPDHIGRYTDEFYPTATGDNFQKLGHNTILIEAGHFSNDYKREEVRKFNFYALIQGIFHISQNNKFENHTEYFRIPNNIKNFYDVIYRSKNNKKDIAYQYVEQIESNKFALTLVKKEEGDLSSYLGHKEINKSDSFLSPL
ncbi:MAG TPA: zinc carboxypeptidase [Tenacibaculum sp.]|nr:zinc carboxypeptidase [Tenacibaculum sp.]